MAFARNNNAIIFANISAVPTHLGMWTNITGGSLLGSDNATITPTPAVGDTVTFDANTIEIEIPDGELTDEGSNKAVDGFILGGIYLALHTGSPTTSNQVDVDGDIRKEIAANQWTVTDN